MALELRDRGGAEGWLAAGLCLMRLARPSADELQAVAPWVVGALAETPALPPAAFVADVGRLALGAPLQGSSAIELPTCDPVLRASVARYEDQLLGRLAADSRLDAVADAIRRLPAAVRDSGISLLAGHLLERIGFGAGVAISPGVARRVVQRPADEILAEGYARLGESGEVSALVAQGYEALAQSARHAGTLLADSIVFTLENVAALGSRSQRLAIEQIVEVAEELAKGLPRRLKRRAASRGRTPTRIEDESVYPIGGFSSISTYGSLENLVSSELIYMDQTQGSEAIDLFDVRYAEGELLYYMRDESVHVRNRRVLSFVLCPDLESARFKDAEVRWQRLVIVLGLVLCAVRRLGDWLSDEALTLRAVFVRDATGAAPLAAELALCRLLLGEWIEKGNAEVVEAPDLDAALADAVAASRRAESDLIAFTAAAPPLAPHPRVRAALVSVEAPRPALRWLDPRRAPAAAAGDEECSPWQAWCALALALLRELV